MWCFLRMIPLMIGQFISLNHEGWHVLLLCLDVVEHICANKFRKSDISYLSLLIEEFNTKFESKYANDNYKTKPK